VSTTIPVAMVRQFEADVLHLAQQKGSRLRTAIKVKDKVVGKSVEFERLAAGAMQKRTSRHQPTFIGNATHSRRRATLESWERGELMDEEDDVMVLIEPENEYVEMLGNAAGRQIDDIVIGALGGNATSVAADDSTSSVALPSAQKVLASVGTTTGLNLLKVTTAKKIFDDAEVPEEDRFLLIGSTQLNVDCLNSSAFTSADFNTVKALVKGEINEYLGFTWIRSSRLLKPSTDRLCYAFQRGAVGLGIGRDITTSIDKRPDLSNARQVLVKLTMGAVRREEARVVEIQCTES